jgi:hypothetical protein
VSPDALKCNLRASCEGERNVKKIFRALNTGRAVVLVLLSAIAVNTVTAREQATSARPAPCDQQVSAFYMFRSWESPDKLVMILNSNPAEPPASGPAFFGFCDNVVYKLSVDNNLDGVADDTVFEFRFQTEHRNIAGDASFPWSYIGTPRAANPLWHGITALDGSGSEGLGVRQVYSVTEVRHGQRHALFDSGRLIAVPPNVGPNTMPAYEALAAKGIYTDWATGIRVFAGPRSQTAYGDPGALFDGVNLRRDPPFLTASEDADDFHNPFGVNASVHANVQSIAIEVPITDLTLDRMPASSTAFPMLGAYASMVRVGEEEDESIQISRMGNPTFRMLVVPEALKAKWDAAAPEHDHQFQGLLAAPAFSQLLANVAGLPVPPPPRVELLGIIFKYPGQALQGTDCGFPCADLLRVNVRVPPTPAESQHRLGALLSPDPAGLPNGCRPNDDVTDISLRAFGGPAYFAARIGDGVNFLENAVGAGVSDGPGYGSIPGNRLDVTPNGIVKEFPFMPTAHDGRSPADSGH